MQPETCPSRKKHRCHQLANRLGMVLIPLLALILSGADSEIQESTADGPLPPAADKQVRFMVDVRPILQNKCIRCHGGGKNKGKFKIDTRETILEGGVSGPSAVVGDSTNSLLVRLVSGTDPDSVMPPEGTPLTAEQVGILRAWIDQGAQWDEGFILGGFQG
ncbi:MAG: Planctomycete cytochrome C, partial [Candidatus Hinthialibacteria bacterium OLB16]